MTGTSSTTFDYVLVGAGPSCMGLLLGLLAPYCRRRRRRRSRRASEGEEGDTAAAAAPPPIPPFTIAVLERGLDDNVGAKRRRASRWFAAAHDDDRKGSGGDRSPSSSSPPPSLMQGRTKPGRVLDFTVGTGRGGTTNVHASLCVPPSRDDFASWPSPLPSLRDGDSDSDSTAAMLMMDSVEVILHHLRENGCLYSHPPPTDGDGRLWKETVFPSSITSVPVTVSADHPEERRNYYEALIAPLLEENPHVAQAVTWLRGYSAERLLFAPTGEPPLGPLAAPNLPSTTKVVGVECSVTPLHAPSVESSNATTFVELIARKDVILCSGAIETPALLQVSGIGLKEDLERAGTSGRLRLDSPVAVGHYLRDHVMLARAMITTSRNSRDKMSITGVRELHQVQIEQSRFQLGVMDATIYPDVLPHVLAGMFRWNFGTATNSSGALRKTATLVLQTLLCSVVFSAMKRFLYILVAYPPFAPLLRRYVTGIAVNLLNPVSVGKVSVLKRRREQERKSPCDGQEVVVRRSDVDIVIDPPYLRDDVDLETMRKTWNACKTVGPQGLEFFPGPLVRKGPFSTELDKSRFCFFAHVTCLPYYHYCGTCSMKTNMPDGEDGDWVVDSKFRVRNVGGLRICDASVFPNSISGPIALTCAALGHLGSRVLFHENDEEKLRTMY